MPTVQPLGNFLEFGTGAAGNAGRNSANSNKIGFDTNGYLYSMKRNAESDSRAAGVPTAVDLSVSAAASRGAVCIQPAANRLHDFAGVWASSVSASTTDGAGNDYQWLLFYGSYSACPINSAASSSHAATGSLCMYYASAAADSFDGGTIAATAQADVLHFQGGTPLGGSVASNISTANMWFNLGPK